MASIFKRSNGIYYIRYEEDGQIKWKSTSSAFIAEGREALKQFEYLLEQAKPRTPFYSFVKDFLQYAQVTYAKKLKSYVLRAGLNPKLHFHSLRHTFATWLVQDGVGIYEVQKLLGHRSIAVTQIYSHLASSELHSAVSKISVLC